MKTERLKELTPAQRRLLGAAVRHKLGRVVGGDLRTRALLSGRGLIEPDGYCYCYGVLFKITELGRQAVVGIDTVSRAEGKS